MPSITHVVAGFRQAFEAMHDPVFCKTYRFWEWNERDLNPLLRMFLEGRYGRVKCEITVPSGRIDYQVGNIAIEFAVAPYGKGAGLLGSGINAKELAKLAEFYGPSLLVLLDFNSPACFERESFRRRYRERWAKAIGSSTVNVTAIGWSNDEVVSDSFQLRASARVDAR